MSAQNVGMCRAFSLLLFATVFAVEGLCLEAGEEQPTAEDARRIDDAVDTIAGLYWRSPALRAAVEENKRLVARNAGYVLRLVSQAYTDLVGGRRGKRECREEITALLRLLKGAARTPTGCEALAKALPEEKNAYVKTRIISLLSAAGYYEAIVALAGALQDSTPIPRLTKAPCPVPWRRIKDTAYQVLAPVCMKLGFGRCPLVLPEGEIGGRFAGLRHEEKDAEIARLERWLQEQDDLLRKKLRSCKERGQLILTLEEPNHETEKRMTENEQLLEQARQAATRFQKAASRGGPIDTNKTEEQDNEEARSYLDDLREEERSRQEESPADRPR